MSGAIDSPFAIDPPFVVKLTPIGVVWVVLCRGGACLRGEGERWQFYPASLVDLHHEWEGVFGRDCTVLSLEEWLNGDRE